LIHDSRLKCNRGLFEETLWVHNKKGRQCSARLFDVKKIMMFNAKAAKAHFIAAMTNGAQNLFLNERFVGSTVGRKSNDS
jgi:hypothetical protein